MIRSRYYEAGLLKNAPADFPSAPINTRGYPDTWFILQIYLEDCTGCALRIEACPAHSPLQPDTKALNIVDKLPILERERVNIACFERLPVNDRGRVDVLQRARRAVPAAAVRVSRCLCRLRRDALPAAAEPAVRRPAAGRQRNRLLVDLRRQPVNYIELIEAYSLAHR
ncbi:hypothetical protein [Stutzerimonas stutzeri]|uniref:hypothetical protein n=1 Tax=Stutzerimonas stutzeri TaxID=316 RepID=UPI00210CC9C5|nr:hypothetical protein [Stutzerimonas stutzeri]